MHTKLTLRIDDDLIKRTKKIAKDRNLSLSEIVAEYFKSLSGHREEGPSSPILDEISGILSSSKMNKDARESYRRHLAEKCR